jgi:hypothetical protein
VAILDAGGQITLKPVTFRAKAVSAAYAVTPESPPDGSLIPALAVTLRFLVSSTSASFTDVEVQLDNDPDYTSPVYANTLVGLEDGSATVTVSGLTADTRYHWRVRAAETGTTGWTEWVDAGAFDIWLDAGKAIRQVDLNVGPIPRGPGDANGYIEMNAGPLLVSVAKACHYSVLNVGPLVQPEPTAFGYVHYGDCSANTPTPHIWFLRPTRGRAGDGVEVVGFGFGDLQSTYNGGLEYNVDGLGEEWDVLPVTGWQSFPPTPNAYEPERTLDAELGVIDMQHTVIEFTIPTAAEAPGHAVRVVTDGP